MSRWFRMTGAHPNAIPEDEPMDPLHISTDPVRNDDDMDHEEEDDLVDEDLFADVWEGRPVRHLFWEDANHWQVISGVYGSVWPRVLPFCLVNVLWSLAVFYLRVAAGIDLTVKPSAFKYLSALVSFLVVTRLKITFTDYMANAKLLSGLNRACQDLVANLCLLTSNDKSRRAKQWRQDVTYSVLLMLRVAIGVLDFSRTKENPWLLDELANENEEEVLKYSFKVPEPEQQRPAKLSPIAKAECLAQQSIDRYDATVADLKECQRDGTTTRMDGDEELLDMPNLKQRLAHVEDSERNVLEESSRAVFNLALNVRREILKQRDGTWFVSREDVWQHPCNEETRLLDFVGIFLANFSGLYRRITTPMPFPLVQMNKILLFLWLFSMPMCLGGAKMNQFMDQPVMICIVVFMISFGFLGIEFVRYEPKSDWMRRCCFRCSKLRDFVFVFFSVELADSFGNHPSDFDDLGQAQLTMEDCYISIYRQDGRNWAKALRKRVKPRSIGDEVPPLSETPLDSSSNGGGRNTSKSHTS